VCSRFAAYYNGTPPGRLGPDHIKAYQVHLVREKKVAWSTLNLNVCALRFLFCQTLGKDWAVKHIEYAKPLKKLPQVLSLEEVEQFLEPIKNIKHRAMLVLAYATGLRLMEVATLKLRGGPPPRRCSFSCASIGRSFALITGFFRVLLLTNTLPAAAFLKLAPRPGRHLVYRRRLRYIRFVTRLPLICWKVARIFD
jgi:hypothetical protein